MTELPENLGAASEKLSIFRFRLAKRCLSQASLEDAFLLLQGDTPYLAIKAEDVAIPKDAPES